MERIRIGRILLVVGILLAIIIVSAATFVTIESGQKGVLYKKLGGGLEKDRVYGQGLHIIAPWNTMFIYDVREQLKEETMSVLSSDGLNIKLDVSVRFRPTPEKIGYLHDEIGPNYKEIIVRDLARSTVRRIIGRYRPEEIYKLKREEIESEVQVDLEKSLLPKNIILESALLRDIDLPPQIEQAIQDKLTAEQEAEKIDFRIQREKKEAERLIIEARAKAEANRILSASLTEKLLQEKGIEATKTLAQSNNSKVVVIGSGKDGLPIILGNQ